LQHIGNLGDSCPKLLVEAGAGKRFPQFIYKLDRDGREIVDEIKRVLDLVCNTGCQLTK
jgi:hypothetical protein